MKSKDEKETFSWSLSALVFFCTFSISSSLVTRSVHALLSTDAAHLMICFFFVRVLRRRVRYSLSLFSPFLVESLFLSFFFSFSVYVYRRQSSLPRIVYHQHHKARHKVPVGKEESDFFFSVFFLGFMYASTTTKQQQQQIKRKTLGIVEITGKRME